MVSFAKVTDKTLFHEQRSTILKRIEMTEGKCAAYLQARSIEQREESQRSNVKIATATSSKFSVVLR